MVGYVIVIGTDRGEKWGVLLVVEVGVIGWLEFYDLENVIVGLRFVNKILLVYKLVI